MSGIPVIAIDTVNYDEFAVVDSSGSVVTGLVDGNFTRALYSPSGSEVSGSITVTISELGNGRYRVNFTPNAEGNWLLIVFHATHFPAGIDANYRCGDILTGNDSTKLDELHKLQGLDSSNPMTVTPTTRTAGSIDQEISGDGVTTSTVTRI